MKKYKNKLRFVPAKDVFLLEKMNGHILREFEKVEPLIPNIPSGQLHIRGNKKEKYTEYLISNGVWYLTCDINKFNGHRSSIDAEFFLHPSLSDKEWKELNKFSDKLSRLWRRRLDSYNCYMELRKIERDIKKDFL